MNVIAAEEQMRNAGIAPAIVIDCSHANCGKREQLQAHVLRDFVQQRIEGNTSIIGVMLESFLEEGNQNIGPTREDLVYGKSVTDPCIGWEMTEALLRETHAKLAACVVCDRRGKGI